MENSTPKKKMPLWQKILIGFVLLVIISNIYSSLNPTSKVESTPQKSESNIVDSGSESPTEARENWEYSEDKDKMSGVTNLYASTTSTNTIDFDFPYNGGSSFVLTVRKQEGKIDVLLSVSKGQFIGGIGTDGSVDVKFDDEKPEHFSFGGSSDGSADVIFIHNEKKFLSKLKKAKKLMIGAQFYQAGKKVIEFDVAGLEWNK